MAAGRGRKLVEGFPSPRCVLAMRFGQLLVLFPRAGQKIAWTVRALSQFASLLRQKPGKFIRVKIAGENAVIILHGLSSVIEHRGVAEVEQRMP